MCYRDYLASRGVVPIVIERTAKRVGDRVLDSSVRPVRTVKQAEAA